MTVCLLLTMLLAAQVGAADDIFAPLGGPPTNEATNEAAAGDANTLLNGGLAPPPGNTPPPAGNPVGSPPASLDSPLGGSLAQPGGYPTPPTSPQSGAPAQGTAGGAASSEPPDAGPPSILHVKPSALIREVLAAPRDSQLQGLDVELIHVVSGAPSRAEQARRLEAYWDLCSSVADYYLGLREQQELQAFQTRGGRSGPAWDQARAELATRIGTAQRAARAAQLRVASLQGRGDGHLPLPGDPPHCGSYHTRYEEIFVDRGSPEAQELAALLPLRYAELREAANAVQRAGEFVEAVARKDQGDGTGTLRSLELLALRRRAFVQLARDYNRRIARYAELAAPGDIPAEQLVGMLIKEENGATGSSGPPESSAGQRPRDSSASLPRTQGWEPAGSTAVAGNRRRDDSVRQAGGAEGQATERSLLVPRQQ